MTRRSTPVEEPPEWRVYGPHGQEVAALIKRARRLTLDEIQQLEVAQDVPNTNFSACIAARLAALEAAQDHGTLYPSLYMASRDAYWAARHAAMDAGASDQLRYYAQDTAVDAATVLTVRDLISEQDFEALYRPWREVIA